MSICFFLFFFIWKYLRLYAGMYVICASGFLCARARPCLAVYTGVLYAFYIFFQSCKIFNVFYTTTIRNSLILSWLTRVGSVHNFVKRKPIKGISIFNHRTTPTTSATTSAVTAAATTRTNGKFVSSFISVSAFLFT